jgi:hypothetical protein
MAGRCCMISKRVPPRRISCGLSTIVDKKALGLQLALPRTSSSRQIQWRSELHLIAIGDTGYPPKRVLVVDDDPAIRRHVTPVPA